jgi:rubrerythrin
MKMSSSGTEQWKCVLCGYVFEGDVLPERCPVCGASKSQFVLLEPLAEPLEKILKEAFAGESKAHVRNVAFAKRAEQEGLHQVARLFRAVAGAERVHSEEYLKYLEGSIGDTEMNLRTAFENEIKANTEIYPSMIKEANRQGRTDVAASFSRAKDVEARHAKLYRDMLDALVSDQDVEYHICTVCGYVFNAELPEKCPVCAAGRERFERIN